MDNENRSFLQLSAFLDDELPEAEAEEVRRRISTEEPWRREYECLSRLDCLLHCWDRRELEGLRASAGFERRLYCRLGGLGRLAGCLRSGLRLPTLLLRPRHRP